MQSSQRSWATVQQHAFRFLCLGMVAALLAGALFAAQPLGYAQAATTAVCANVTSVPALDWNNAATWDCGHVPTSADDVIIANAAEVDFTVSQAIHSLTIGGATGVGILRFTSAQVLSISGDLTVLDNGLLDPGSLATGGTVVLNGAGNQTITAVDSVVDFWNLSKISSAAGQTLFFNTGTLGEIHILNILTLKGTAANHLALQSTAGGTQWDIASDGPRDLNWLDVKDANNVGPSVISLVVWTDLGNNTAWAKDTDTTSSLAIAAPLNPSFGGHPVTLTFRVYPSTASGNVTFFEGLNAIIGCENMLLVDGAVGCKIDGMTVGAHAIYAVFDSANSNFTDATATILVQKMNLAFYLPVAKK